MKKMICLILTVVFVLGATALAAVQTYELNEGKNGYFACEDFAGVLPEIAKGIFRNLIWESDEILCGTLFQEHYRNNPGKVNRGGALIAVRRDGKILLMSANGKENTWHAGIETDSFLPPDAQFSITTTLGMYAHLTILYRDTAYEIRTNETGGAYVYEYNWTDENGMAKRMDCYHGEFRLYNEGEGFGELIAEGAAIPNRLAAWSADALPKDEVGIRAFEEAYPLEADDDEAFLYSVNLRERATGESASWGKYAVKVKVLGEQPGKVAPWVHVRVGNLEGWVSGEYVYRRGAGNQMHVYDTATNVHAVGRVKHRTEIFEKHGAQSIMQLNENTYVHVLGERDGWLHVIVPREELTWRTDWDGTYGFVRAEDMVVGISKADVMWRN